MEFPGSHQQVMSSGRSLRDPCRPLSAEVGGDVGKDDWGEQGSLRASEGGGHIARSRVTSPPRGMEFPGSHQKVPQGLPAAEPQDRYPGDSCLEAWDGAPSYSLELSSHSHQRSSGWG